MAPLKHVTPGERLTHSAATHNALVDAARHVQQIKSSLDQASAETGWATGVVAIKNNSGADREQFDVLGIDGIFPTPAADPKRFKIEPVLLGIKPTTADHRGRFVILLAPVKQNEISSAVVSGISVAKVNVPSAAHEGILRADVKHNDPGSLETHLSGAVNILWKESGYGVKWAVVAIGQPEPELSYWGKLDDDLGVGNSQTAVIWLGDPLADSGISITAYAPPVLTAGQIDKDQFVEITWKPAYGKFYVTEWPRASTTTQVVQTDYRYDISSNKLQKKQIELTVAAKGTESGWLDVYTATQYPVVMDTRYDTGTNKFQDRSVVLTVLEAADPGAWEDVHQATTQTVLTAYQYDSQYNKLQMKTTELTVLEKAAESGWQDLLTAITREVVIDYQYDTGSNKFQKKTIDLVAFEEGAASGWTDVYGPLTARTVITDIQVSGLTLQEKTRDLITMEGTAESGWSTFHTGTDCP